MKNLLLLFCVLLFSCSKEGEITNSPGTVYLINGKEYKFYQVSPANNSKGVWILVPFDSTIPVPISTKYSYTTRTGGKHSTTTTHSVNTIVIP